MQLLAVTHFMVSEESAVIIPIVKPEQSNRPFAFDKKRASRDVGSCVQWPQMWREFEDELPGLVNR